MKWKQIAGYEDYWVSDTGLVRSLKYGKERILRAYKDRKGYLAVQLCKNGKVERMLVHRLVAEAFIPNPLGLETVNHRDEDKTNNEVFNLDWLTVADNVRYGTGIERCALAHGKPVCQLDALGNLVGQFPSMSEAERQTGINQSNISLACNGRRKTAGGYSWRYA